MSDRSTDSGDLSLSCSFSSVESDRLEVSKLDNAPETIEPYQPYFRHNQKNALKQKKKNTTSISAETRIVKIIC